MLDFDVVSLLGSRLGERLVLELSTGPLVLEDISVDFLQGSVRFTRIREGLLVEGEIASRVTVECVRCLSSFSLPVTFTLDDTVGLPGAPEHPDIVYRVTEEGWINLEPMLREHLWTSIPLKALCRPDCRGLCPKCGVNLNVDQCACEQEPGDPRLSGLRDLVKSH